MSTFWQIISSGFFVIAGSWLTYFFQKKFAKNDETKRKLAFLISIKAEISSVWNGYYENIGNSVEELQDHAGFDSIYPIFDRYFLVYDNNTNLLGNLTKELSESIVKTYLLAKSLKDSFLFNNDILAKMNYYYDLMQESDLDHHKTQHMNYRKMWVDYGSGIKEMHFLLKKDQENLINLINEQIEN